MSLDAAPPANVAPPPPPIARPPKQKRSQIACIHCNRRRTRCDASRVGIPCSSCKDLGLTDCQFINSKRSCKIDLRKHSLPQQPVEAPPTTERENSVAKAPSVESTSPGENRTNVAGDEETKSPDTNITSPTNSNSHESDTWLRAANVTSFANKTGEISVSYLGKTWLIPRQFSEEASRASRLNYFSTLPSGPGTVFCTRMISSYFSAFHPIYPIIDRVDFNESLQKGILSTLLLETVVLAGVTHSKLSVLQDAGFKDRREAIQHFYDKLMACLNDTHKGENMVLIQCMFILQFYWSSLSDWKDSKFWLATSIRQSQYLGLHKEKDIQKLTPAKQSICRRLWWSLYVRDRQCSTALGIPVLIQDEDCDTRAPTMDDMDEETPTDAKLAFLQLIELMREVRPMLQTEFRAPRGDRESLREGIVHACERWQAQIPDQLKNPVESQGTAVFHLHICYYSQMLMFNRSVSQNHEKSTSFIDINALVASHAASMITTLTEQLAERLDSKPLPFYAIYSIFAAVTVQIVERNNRAVTDSIKDQQLWSNLTRLKEMGETYPIAEFTSGLFAKVMRQPDETKPRSQATNVDKYRPSIALQSSFSEVHDPSSYNLWPQTQNHIGGEMKQDFNSMELDTRHFADIGHTTPGLDDIGAILEQSVNGINHHGQSEFQSFNNNFTDDWAAMYEQLELDKTPLF